MNGEKIKVPQQDKTLTPGKLFYNWFAANIGIMGIVFGAIIVSYHLSFIQATLASLVGALSFVFPGWVAMIGKREGVTTFKLSRAAYGVQGNKVPNGIAWVNMVGWLAINVITGTLLLVSLLQVVHINKSAGITAIALAVFAGIVILSGLVNETILARIQTWLSWLFGGLTVVILIFFLIKADWQQALARPAGKWLGGFWPAVSIVAAGSGISWSMAAADWSAYVKPQASQSATFWHTLLGGAVPLFILMWGGVLLSTVEPGLASAANPIEVMSHALPSWMTVIYFLVAAGGLIPQCMISLRSARINLATVGIKMSQAHSLILHSAIVIALPVYVLFIAEDFMGNFELFLGFLGTCLAAWVAVFLCDSVLYRQDGYALSDMMLASTNHYNWKGIGSWLVAVITGFLFTNNAVWNGPFARGIFRDNSLGVFVAAVAAVICMVALRPLGKKLSEEVD
ncbi:purine-cytosine permease family protein [Levilactobacillus tujiorum]|uniref:purine-cytosine permease family protein n=1 Tax=Levilactobacillus tujiorum TaxID=2912243 RepID=UPI001456DCD1|nr:cytosine permease [Levilactobacillus tujiorum]NLR32323.1 allantoin permease [Levilactobacillus tujiorum]